MKFCPNFVQILNKRKNNTQKYGKNPEYNVLKPRNLEKMREKSCYYFNFSHFKIDISQTTLYNIKRKQERKIIIVCYPLSH